MSNSKQDRARVAGGQGYEVRYDVYITKPVDYEGFATAIRNLGLFFSVIQVP